MRLSPTLHTMSKVYDSIIVGAGWSGAVAARDLARAGRSVLVLEARDRVGGRASTWVGKDGAKVDIGCSWIHGYNEGSPARTIATELGVTAHLPKPVDGVIYGPSGPLAADKAASLRVQLGAALAAFKTPFPAPAPSQSLASALFGAGSPLTTSDGALASGLARSLEVPLGLKLEKASLRWAGWEGATNFSGSDAAPEGGYEALVASVVAQAEAAGAVVKLGSAATQVKDEGGKVQVQAGGETYTARTVLSTIPLGTLKAAPKDLFSPPLDARYAATVEGTHVGVLEKLLLAYPAAWWPRATEVGSYTFLPTKAEDSLGPNSTLRDVFDASTIIAANFAGPALPSPSPILLSYLSETPARAALAHSEEDVAAAFHEFLVARLGVPDAPKPSESALTTWLNDPLSRGATTTPSIVSDGGERSPLDFKELSRPLWDGRLGFAGEHTEIENRGSVAGAVISGQREAGRIERLLNKLDAK
ncbi:putative polyamine oxidase 4 [Vanrija pseudolonga]|uniref:Polyamine oxidase 4 n=1 Tax=Vanrija pseudolonga TaxID=143232 RepID=A0AAF0YE99_9TREE|nr:putative polyamine oxidase 4 [Vanrija pseudolonga]